MPFLLLTIDGGGVRGAFASAIIAHIEKDLGHSITQHVQAIAGTSTGAIIASCLSKNFSGSNIVDFYLKSCSHIFQRKLKFTPKVIEKALHSPYDNLRLKAILRQILGKDKLSSLKIPLIIPSTNIQNGSSCIFTSFSDNKDTSISDAVMASCAAPAFFDPIVLNKKLLADGGLYANNPGIIAIAQLSKHFLIPFNDFKVLSLGTGHFSNCYDLETKNWGLVSGWKVRTLADFIASVQSQTTFETLKTLTDSKNLLRVNFLKETLISPDEFDKIEQLVTLADNIYKKKRDEILSFILNKN